MSAFMLYRLNAASFHDKYFEYNKANGFVIHIPRWCCTFDIQCEGYYVVLFQIKITCMFQPTQAMEKKMIAKVIITVLFFKLKLPICFQVILLLLGNVADATQLR